MGNLVVVGFCHLQTHFGTYEQFVTPLCNVFLNVRSSLWNGTQEPCTRSSMVKLLGKLLVISVPISCSGNLDPEGGTNVIPAY